MPPFLSVFFSVAIVLFHTKKMLIAYGFYREVCNFETCTLL